jgi:hypothetical protein
VRFQYNGERKDVELIIEAEIEGLRDEQSFYYRFSNGFFDVNGGEFKLPYPVPFDFIESVLERKKLRGMEEKCAASTALRLCIYIFVLKQQDNLYL